MAAISSAATGNWSVGGTWVGGVAPTSADTVTIQVGHAITVDTTGCNALSVTLSSTSSLLFSASVNTSLTVQTFIKMYEFGVSTLTADLSGNPAVTCTINLNASTTGGNFSYLAMYRETSTTLKGAPRTRNTTTVGAITGGVSKTVVIADATGWRVGDKLVFASTQAYHATTPKFDEVTIDTITFGAGTTATITWIDGLGATGSVAYDHAALCKVGNFTSNLTILPAAGYNHSYVRYVASAGTYTAKTIKDVALWNMGDNGDSARACFDVSAERSSTSPLNLTLESCAFYNFGGIGVRASEMSTQLLVDKCCFYTVKLTNGYGTGVLIQGTSLNGGGSRNCGVYAIKLLSGSGYYDTGGSGFAGANSATWYVQDSFASSCMGVGGIALVGGGITVTNFESFSNYAGFRQWYANYSIANSNIGVSYGGAATNSILDSTANPGYGIATISDTNTQTITSSGLSTAFVHTNMTWLNKNNDVVQQEIYRPFMNIIRNNVASGNTYRSTSSVGIYPTRISTDCQRTVSIPCANTASVRIVGWVKKSHATNISATVAITGLGSSVTPFTKANDTAWEKYDFTATNSSGVDGNFTLTYTANSSSGTTNSVFFDGVPDSPFVTKCRHYGFTFDEANPVRTENTILTTLGVTETTAIGYTGVTISPTQITVGAGTANTWLKVYGYAQAHACANLTTTVNLTSTDGNTFALPTTYKLSWPAMGTDGTLAGGWLLLSTTGTHTYKLSGTKIEFQAAGSYTMSASTFSGTVELVNTSGGAVTVFLPSGTSYTNTGPSITVSTPIIQQSVTLTGVVAGSRVQIYDTTNSIELFNGTSGYSWTDTVAAVAPRDIRVRIAYQSGTTAYNFVEANIGTCGTTSPSNAVTYLASQTLDTVYNANGLDGSAVTGITISDGIDRMVINIGGGSVSWPQIYAYNVYWLTTSAGIVDDGSIIVARDTANYSVTLFKIRNSSATPLNITGGYGTDSSTGTVAPLIDTAGSTGNIYQTPDHVVAYQTSGSYAITGDIATVLTAVGNVPTGVRTELTTELARIDVATSTRLSTAGYTAPTTPPTAAAISAQVLADASATPIAADTKAINGVTLQGAGTTLDPMRPV